MLGEPEVLAVNRKGILAPLLLTVLLVVVSACRGDRDMTGLEAPPGAPFTVRVSDGCEGIQTAIDSLPSSGGQIIVQAGELYVHGADRD